MDRPSNVTSTSKLEPQPTKGNSLTSDNMAKGESSGKVSMSEKVRAKISKLRKKPHVSDEQRLQAKIDSLHAEAGELHGECTRLQGAPSFPDISCTCCSPCLQTNQQPSRPAPKPPQLQSKLPPNVTLSSKEPRPLRQVTMKRNSRQGTCCWVIGISMRRM
ncbi:hypothetical protein DOTSEDRAFT_71140 [Dothistroma septosporum NZE10]|uniref:Uncharacterized protein n=1 Tax=Dothistroma septosporum (strain NZE10 / CBS 128990) TaxID=675120 RepID=N1PPG2_DOTSN|nr:hypothetical protein DOTSEDRAFT_71140 [Dothistroma septosporum NZE10]